MEEHKKPPKRLTGEELLSKMESICKDRKDLEELKIKKKLWLVMIMGNKLCQRLLFLYPNLRKK